MPGEYATLAPIYDSVGMAVYSTAITPKLMDFAQRMDWLGRRIVVLGCGTGGAIEYLSQYPYTITGVDSSPEMLEVARRKLDIPGLSIKWLQLDMRDTGNQIMTADMVLALNVMNELNSLRDLETVFATAQRILDSGKLFIFDMMTIQGLSPIGSSTEQVMYDDGQSVTMFSAKDYDYERQIQTINHIIFRQQKGSWNRSEARQVLRTFPVQAVASLLQRNRFNIRTILNNRLENYEPGVSHADRVIFFAEKQSA
ncbi:MAG: methyltransferase domain-containing protein [Anaerolineaceae bacterium]|nr:methyltransferase domain-containing protein [Anaerolineaceae bacterium]